MILIEFGFKLDEKRFFNGCFSIIWPVNAGETNKNAGRTCEAWLLYRNTGINWSVWFMDVHLGSILFKGYISLPNVITEDKYFKLRIQYSSKYCSEIVQLTAQSGIPLFSFEAISSVNLNLLALWPHWMILSKCMAFLLVSMIWERPVRYFMN